MDATLDFRALTATGCLSCGDWQPLKLDGWLLAWLRHHFALASNVTFPALQDKLWTAAETTGILIESVGRWRPQLTEKRPGLIIKGHGLQALQIGIGDRMMGGGGTDAARDVRSSLVTGSHTIFCVGGEYGECQLLSSEVFREVLKFRHLFTERLGFVRITPPQSGGIGKLEEARQNFVCPVSFGYSFWETWEITPRDSAVARFFDLALTTQTL